MARVSRVFGHLSIEAVTQKLLEASSAWQRRRWLIIHTALVAPRSAEAIAQQTGTSVWTVHQVVSRYNRNGAAVIATVGKGGRRHSYLSWQAEQELLAPFFQQAATGKIPTAAVIQPAFEQQVGEAVDPSTIYRLLQRHQWRKLVPRPHHPQAEPTEPEAFKKTFHSS